MKSFLTLLFLFFAMGVHAQSTDAALQVLQRVTGSQQLPVRLQLTPSPDGTPTFSHQVTDGRLTLSGSSPVALCRGFYDYVKRQHCGLYTWSGNSIRLPEKLDATETVRVNSPYLHHYYLNVVTYGYTMPYWDWARWEQEIDWMALHGMDMPLALVGYEAILARVWKKMGLTDDEINGYFVGPAHLPWMRMGNISGIDGPLNNDWHHDQIALQHRILDRMRSLGMQPICPGFPGFVPQAFQRLYPGLSLTETHWGGAFSNWMLSPDDPLFSEMSRRFIAEWEAEFGKCGYYLVDSFNEMDLPFPEKGNPARYEMAAHYGEKVYEGIRAANPQAVWVMQGWMFGYQRHIWDEQTLGALVSRVPDDKMMLLDLAVDYNRHFWHSQVNWEYYHGFFNKPWVYSVIPNMGGKTGMTGVLEFYANGHLDALHSPCKGRLVAYGMAPEGLENNEVLYELVTDAGWSDRPIDLHQWLSDYSHNRYGEVNASLLQSWDHLLKSCYGTFTDHPRFCWQFRPGLVRQGSICLTDDYFKGLEGFVTTALQMKQTPLLRADLAEMCAHYLGGKAEILTAQIDEEYLLGDTLRAQFLQSRFETLLLGMDSLLSQHPTLRLDRWLALARQAGHTPEQSARYASNARRIVTVWGPPVDDYSARLWSGLIRHYYLPRWHHYYQSRNSGEAFDLPAWELQWVAQPTDDTPAPVPSDLGELARRMLQLSRGISADSLHLRRPGMLGFWHLDAGQEGEFRFVIPAALLSRFQGLRLHQLRGREGVQVLAYRLDADGQTVASSAKPRPVRQGELRCPVTLPAGLQANNGCQFIVRLQATGPAAGYLQAELSPSE